MRPTESQGEPFLCHFEPLQLGAQSCPKAPWHKSVQGKKGKNVSVCDEGKCVFVLTGSPTDSSTTNEPRCRDNETQTSTNNVMRCLRHDTPGWMFISSEEKKRSISMMANIFAKSTDGKAKRSYQSANGLVIQSVMAASSQQTAKKDQKKKKKVFPHSIISAGIMGNLSGACWPCYTMFECRNATKILRESR